MLQRAVRTYHDAFRGLPREVWLIALVTFVNRGGTMVVPFLALYLTSRLHVSPSAAGQLLAVFGAGGVLGAHLGGWATSRFGSFRTLTASFVMTLPCVAWVYLSDTAAGAGVALFVFGTLSQMYRPAAITAALEYAPAKDHGRALAANRLAVNLGMSIGPPLGGFLSMWSFAALFWFDGATSFLALCLLWLFFRNRPRPATESPDGETPAPGRSPWGDRPLLLFFGGVMVTMVIFFQIEGAYMLYLAGPCGLSRAEIGMLLAINPVLIVLFEMVFIARLQKYDPLRTFGVGSFLVGLSFGVLAIDTGMTVVVVSVLIWTLGEMVTMPISAVYVSHRATAADRGRYMGAYTMFFSVAASLVPLIGTAVYEISHTLLWLGCLGVGLAVGCGCWLAAPRRQSEAA